MESMYRLVWLLIILVPLVIALFIYARIIDNQPTKDRQKALNHFKSGHTIQMVGAEDQCVTLSGNSASGFFINSEKHTFISAESAFIYAENLLLTVKLYRLF